MDVRRVMMAVMVVTLTGCSVRVNRNPTDASAVEQASVAYEDAVRRQDINAAASFVAEDAVLMPADAPSMNGRAAYVALLQRVAGQLKVLEYKTTERSIERHGETAIESGVYRQRLKFGEMERTFDTRYIYIWKNTGSTGWKITRALYNHTAPLR